MKIPTPAPLIRFVRRWALCRLCLLYRVYRLFSSFMHISRASFRRCFNLIPCQFIRVLYFGFCLHDHLGSKHYVTSLLKYTFCGCISHCLMHASSQYHLRNFVCEPMMPRIIHHSNTASSLLHHAKHRPIPSH